jgi:hypothetical protein
LFHVLLRLSNDIFIKSIDGSDAIVGHVLRMIDPIRASDNVNGMVYAGEY